MKTSSSRLPWNRTLGPKLDERRERLDQRRQRARPSSFARSSSESIGLNGLIADASVDRSREGWPDQFQASGLRDVGVGVPRTDSRSWMHVKHAGTPST